MSKVILTIFTLLVISSQVLAQIDNPCERTFAGTIVHPSYCHQWVICAIYIPVYIGTCDPGYIVHPTSLVCVPGNQQTCEMYESTTSTTTAEPPSTQTTITTPSTTTPIPPIEDICHDVFFGARPHPDSITLFVGCIRGNFFALFQCFENEIFDPFFNECVVVIPTTTEPTTTTSTAPPTTTISVITTLTPPIENICEGIQNEYIEHPLYCALYIYCYLERGTIMQCPEFHIFDVEQQICRYGNQETCEFLIENTNPATEPTAPEPTTEPTMPTPDPETTTPGPEPTTTSAEPTTPSLEPTTPTPEPTTPSPEPTTPSPEPTTPSPEPTSTPVETTTVFNPCSEIQNGSVPDPQNCTRYYRCANGRPVLSQCGPGQIFYPDRSLCVAGNVETCEPTL